MIKLVYMYSNDMIERVILFWFKDTSIRVFPTLYVIYVNIRLTVFDAEPLLFLRSKALSYRQ